jgi:prevent-host-death family protein
MITVGTLEAKTHFSALLERAAAGEEILVTKHGKPFARIVGAKTRDQTAVNSAIERLKQLRKGTTLGELNWKVLRDEGRKY